MEKFQYTKSYFCNAKGVVLCLGPWMEKVGWSNQTSATSEAVAVALKRLSPAQKKFVRLYYFERKSLRQIAEETGKSLSSLRRLNCRARTKLAKLLRDVIKRA